MRIWILIFSAALFVGGTCLGVALQPKIAPQTPVVKPEAPPPPMWDRHRPEFSVHRFATDLELTGEQDRELDAILSDTQEEMRALGRAMRSAQENSRERIVAILTPEQKNKLDGLMAAERQKRADADLSRAADSWKKILKLSDDQAAAFRAILVESRKQRREWKSGADWHQGRKESREQQNKAVEKALTAEQYQRYLEVSELDRYER